MNSRRPDSTACIHCGEPVHVELRGRVARQHVECRAVQYRINELSVALERAAAGASNERKRRLRRLVVSQTMSLCNAAFNVAKGNQHAVPL